jgi:hypothetical protein
MKPNLDFFDAAAASSRVKAVRKGITRRYRYSAAKILARLAAGSDGLRVVWKLDLNSMRSNSPSQHPLRMKLFHS